MDDRKISPKKASWELIDVEGTDKVNCFATFATFAYSVIISLGINVRLYRLFGIKVYFWVVNLEMNLTLIFLLEMIA